MIRGVTELAGVLLMLGAASAASASDPSYLGNWARGDGKTHIRVEPCGGALLRGQYLGAARRRRRKGRR